MVLRWVRVMVVTGSRRFKEENNGWQGMTYSSGPKKRLTIFLAPVWTYSIICPFSRKIQLVESGSGELLPWRTFSLLLFADGEAVVMARYKVRSRIVLIGY